MHDENNLKIASWIAARLKGTIRPEEERALEEWIHENDGHRLFYERMMDQEYLAGRLDEYETCSLEALKERMMPLVRKQGRHIRFMRRVKQIAAVLFIPLVLGGVFLLMDEKEEKAPVVADIVPGKECAVLEMADGRQVELAPGKNLGQLQLVGAVVTNDSNRLSYQQAGQVNQLEYNTIIIPRGGEYQLTLADGSRVWLNSGTRLRYPVAFVGTERRVELEGEGYFEVKRDTSHPFIVETRGQVLTVLGTSFAIRAYEDENAVLTTLESGRVNIASGEEEVELTPGYQSYLAGGKIVVNKVRTSLYTAWHKGIFEFVDQPLKEILRTLSRWYNIEIFYESSELGDMRFTGELRRYDNIQEFLERIQELRKVRFTVANRIVTVSKY